MLWLHATLLLFLLTVTFISSAAAQTDCSRNYEEPCQSYPGDIQDGDAVWPQLFHKVTKRALISNESRLWPNNVIYYKIDTQFTESEKRTILEAMIDWENHTCIRFREEESSVGYVMISLSSRGCCSYIGRVGCKQGLSLNRDCFSKGTVSHELGHVMGLYHEQSRPDRDKYVRIITENIVPTALHNFQKLPSSVIDSLGVPYDHNSIMHYSPTAFSKAGHLYTIVSLSTGIIVGPGQCPSRLDFVQINKLYKCGTSNSSLNSTIQLPPLNPIPPLPYSNCGEVFKGTISFNWVFDHNIDCQWILVVPSGMETSLTILVSLENSGGGLCTKDYVRIHSNGAWGNKYCSDSRVEEKFRDTVVMIKYHTDHFNTFSYEVFTGISITTITGDINECSEGIAGCSHTCTNTFGSFFCSCPEWMYLSCDRKTCIDINECASDNGGCKYSCTNIAGSHTCTCLNDDDDDCCSDGYTLNSHGTNCIPVDVNECLNTSLSQCSQFCVNELNSYHCLCKRGFKLSSDGKNCSDVNECLEFIRPEHHCATCVNFDGDFLCLCADGYTYGPDLHTCVDINECSSGLANCTHDCQNTDGSYTCSCPSGTDLADDGRTCIDIDECTLNLHNCKYGCLNKEGSYLCTCPSGFRTLLESGTCTDINECSSGVHNCSHFCHNTNGSYTCSCPQGMLLLNDYKNCSDIDECSSSNHGCQGSCLNTEGSYRCLCPKGFQLSIDGKSCTDINECSEASTNNCSHFCHNINGSYTCSCPSGFVLSSNDKDCSDINECSSSNHGCNWSCINTEGSYTCLCPEGFHFSTADNGSCADINECSQRTHNCSHYCHNTNGSYTCSCPSSFRLSSNGYQCNYIVSHTTASGSINLNTSNVTWTIQIPNANQAIKLTFLSLSISCSNGGSIEIFSGIEPVSSISLLRTCGGSFPLSPIISSINELSVVYETGNSSDSASLKYETVLPSQTNVKSCFGVVSNGQRFSLPDFPSKYTSSLNCNYYVISSQRTVTLTILYTDLNYESCSNTQDRLIVYSDFQFSQQIGAMCNAKGETVFTAHNYLMVVSYNGIEPSKYRGFEGLVTISD
uniref:Metalloendopeptidase n=1 Tax=Amphimedon queenslandica TaxID=400682 RepID=A0A1X7U6T9_AMPQE